MHEVEAHRGKPSEEWLPRCSSNAYVGAAAWPGSGEESTKPGSRYARAGHGQGTQAYLRSS